MKQNKDDNLKKKMLLNGLHVFITSLLDLMYFIMFFFFIIIIIYAWLNHEL